MRFVLTQEQQQFAASLGELLGGADVPGAARRWAAAEPAEVVKLWRRLADLGVTGLAIDERWGGAGAGMAELAVAFIALGEHAVPGPVVESFAAVPVLLRELGDAELAERWLPRLAGGTPASVALPPEVPYALDAAFADPVFSVRDNELRVCTVGDAHASVDPTRQLSDVDGEVVAAGGQVHSARAAAFNAGALACAAQLLGLGQALLRRTVEYATQRTQFGRPIGSFQAVKHQLADVHIGLEFARPLLFGAALSTSDRDISAAKVAASEAAYRAARVALQVHGAIGYTAEYDLSLWLTKVRALRSAWGTPSFHRARVMEELCSS